jgi:hypothetical protein
MIYEVASVEDKGSYWGVNGVTQHSFATADSEERYLRLSHVSAKLIKDALLDGQEVRINKPLQFGEVLPREVNVIKVDSGDMQSIRDSAIKRVRMLITPELASVSGLAFYGFMCLNNELADKGFFITEENREAKYLAILETGDEKLIQKLEDYLNYRDEISRVAALHKNFEALVKEIKNETSNEKITKLADDFMTDYYSRF